MKAANVFVKYLKRIDLPVDVQIDLPTIRKKLRWGKLRNNLIGHNIFDSTIQVKEYK